MLITLVHEFLVGFGISHRHECLLYTEQGAHLPVLDSLVLLLVGIVQLEIALTGDNVLRIVAIHILVPIVIDSSFGFRL